METQDLLDKNTVKNNVPRWVVALCATLMFLSVFINSIGLNLMQINQALTEKIVNTIEGSGQYSMSANSRSAPLPELDLSVITDRLDALESVSHEPTKPKE